MLTSRNICEKQVAIYGVSHVSLSIDTSYRILLKFYRPSLGIIHTNILHECRVIVPLSSMLRIRYDFGLTFVVVVIDVWYRVIQSKRDKNVSITVFSTRKSHSAKSRALSDLWRRDQSIGAEGFLIRYHPPICIRVCSPLTNGGNLSHSGEDRKTSIYLQ